MFSNLIGKNKELGRFLFCERYTLPPVKNAMYIAEGQDLKRGAVVDVNGVLVGTNSLMPYAVLEFDCDTRSGGKEASVFIKGEFNFDKLTFTSGLSKSDLDNIVYNGSGLGIVIKPYAFDKEFNPKSNGGGGGYKDVNLPPIISAPYNIPVGNREIVTVSYIGASVNDEIQLQLANDCEDAIVFFANKSPKDIAFNKLTITRQDTPNLKLFGTNYLCDVNINIEELPENIVSNVDGGSWYESPTDWSEIEVSSAIKSLNYDIEYSTNSTDTGFLIEIKGNVAILHIH